MKLYDLPQRADPAPRIYGAKEQDTGKDIVILFSHLDGAYSYCTIEGTDKVVHLSAATPLTKFEDGYKIGETET